MSRISISDAVRKNQDNSVRSLQNVASHKIADSFFKVAKDDCRDLYEQGVVASLLDNFAKVMDSELGQGLTTSQDFGPYVMEVWPLVTAWYPDFPLKDLISVQSMDKPLAYLFFSLLKTGTNKSETAVGDVVETALGMRTIKGKYPTGEIVGESVLDSQIDSTDGTILAYYPLNVSTIPGYLEKTRVIISTDRYQARAVEDGFILFKLGTTDITKAQLSIEVATGVLAGSIVTALAGTSDVEALKVNYVWNLDYATTENIQRVKEQVELRPMEATPRALLLEWTIFSEYLKKTQFGQDIREANTKRILNLLYQYQVRYILDELFDGAAGTLQTVSLTISNNYSLEVQSANILKQLNVIGNTIELASGRIAGNRIVVVTTSRAILSHCLRICSNGLPRMMRSLALVKSVPTVFTKCTTIRSALLTKPL
jgi:hypothetical protein